MVNPQRKLQALVYDIFAPATAIAGYTVGLEEKKNEKKKCQLTDSFSLVLKFRLSVLLASTNENIVRNLSVYLHKAFKLRGILSS